MIAAARTRCSPNLAGNQMAISLVPHECLMVAAAELLETLATSGW